MRYLFKVKIVSNMKVKVLNLLHRVGAILWLWLWELRGKPALYIPTSAEYRVLARVAPYCGGGG